MHDEAADTERVGGVRDPQGAVAEEGATEPPALLRAIDREKSSQPAGAGCASKVCRTAHPPCQGTPLIRAGSAVGPRATRLHRRPVPSSERISTTTGDTICA